MWRGSALAQRVRFYDIEPAVGPDVVCSWEALPDADGSVDVLVYDPPHLPIAAASERSRGQLIRDYGLARSTSGDNISAAHVGFLAEARRVLCADGLIFAKIKDYIHHGKYQWCLMHFIGQLEAYGLTACDLIIKRDPCGGNLKSGAWKNAFHARNTHCYWLIVRKGKCTPSVPMHTRPEPSDADMGELRLF
jgi:hypothetical protein